jgi:hypothetical protein
VRRRVGWLAVVIAASGWGFLWFQISHGDIFCGGGPVDCPSLVGEAPRYLALLGIAAPAIAMSIILRQGHVAPRVLGVTAVVAACVGLAFVLVMTIADYDVMISGHTSGRLDVEYRPPFWPPVVRSVAALWPIFIGGWMGLTSLQLLRLGVPVAIAVLGVLAGAAIVVTLPYATEYLVYRSILPLELIVSIVWATAVGVYLTTAGRTSATA